MKKIVTLCIIICTLSTVNAQNKVDISDFKILENTNWKGFLTYKDYSDNKEVILKCTMSISIKKNKIITKIKFPDEPKANSKYSIRIKKKGTYFGNEKIIQKGKLKNEFIKIITFFDGKDNNKKAKIFKTYLFNKESFSIIKEIEYLDSKERFIRNKQNYTRVKNK